MESDPLDFAAAVALSLRDRIGASAPAGTSGIQADTVDLTSGPPDDDCLQVEPVEVVNSPAAECSHGTACWRIAPRPSTLHPGPFPDYNDSLLYTGNFNWWLQPLHKVALMHDLVPTILRNFSVSGGIRYGSDCTGADGPWHGLSLLASSMQHTYSQSCPLSHDLASEIHSGTTDFLKLNVPCNNLGGDYMCRDHSSAPDLHVYTAGFSCVDMSSFNMTGRFRKHCDHQDPESGGQTSKTLAASVQLIKAKEPPVVMLENTYSLKTIAAARRAFKTELPMYKLIIFRACSSRFALPLTRNRLFFIAYNTRRVRETMPTRSWPGIIASYMAALELQPLESILAKEDSAEVAELFSVARTQTSPQWPRCKEKHDIVRSCVLNDDGIELAKEGQTHEDPAFAWLPPCRGWSLLVPREQDLLYLHYRCAAIRGGIDCSRLNLVWDIANNCEYPNKKSQAAINTMPCPLTGHKNWLVHRSRARVMTGAEQMRAQGFGDIKVSDMILSSLLR